MPYLALFTLFIAVTTTLLFLREAGLTGMSVSNESVESLDIEFGLVQQEAEVGMPVKWVKTMEASSLSIEEELPSYATNYVVEELRDEGFIAVDSGPTPMKSAELSAEEVTVYRIEYETPAPQKSEVVISDKVKQVIVTSDVDYTDVLVRTYVAEVPKAAIHVYWLVDSGLPGSEPQELPISDYTDSDGDGLIDEVSWIAPHLSDQTFEVRIEILNVQSYPLVGGQWVVDFTTAGNADLAITAVDNTTFGTDLDFISLKCGDTVLDATVNNNTISYPGYECNDTGHEASLVLTQGSHHLMFQFGDETGYAHNYAVVSEGSALIAAHTVYYETSSCTGTNPSTWCAITNYGGTNVNYSGEMNFSTSSILNKNITSASVCLYQYFGSLQYTIYAENLTSISCAGNSLAGGLQQTSWFAQGINIPIGWFCADVTDFVRSAVDNDATSFNVRFWGEDIASATGGYDCFRGPASAVANCGGSNPSGANNCTSYLNVTYDTISGNDDRLYPTKNKGVYSTSSSTTALYMGEYSTNYMNSLYEFDLSAYEGKTIGGAQFYCRVNSGSGQRGVKNITAYRITQDWTEANATDLTTAPSYSTTTAYGGVNIPDDSGGRYHWDITTLVRAWLDGTYANQGFVLRQTDSVDATNNYTYCYSRTAASVPDRPYLELYSADCLEPYNDLSIRSDVTLCPGTYYINDSGSNGVLIAAANNINITCDGTVIIGNSSNYGLYSSSDNNIVVRGCTFKNYTYGVYVSTGNDWLIENNTFMYNNASTYTYGVYLSNSDRINVTGCNFTNNSIGIGAFLTDDNRIIDSVFDGNAYQGIRTSGNRSYIFNNVFDGRASTDNFVHMFNSAPNNCEQFVIANNSMANATSYALYIQSQSIGNNITDNTIGNGSNYAIYLGASTNTTLVWNNDLSRASGIILYNGNASNEFNYTTIGNHWSSYDRPDEGCYDDVMPGGICDAALPMAKIDGVDINTDNFPFAYSPTGGCIVPVDDLKPTSDITLCYGRYEVNDSGTAGIVIVSANGVDVTCDETRLIGNTSGRGFNSAYSNGMIVGCNASNYSYGYVLTGANNIFSNIASRDSGTAGMYLSGSSNNISYFISYNDSVAFSCFGGSYNNMNHSIFYYPRTYGLSLQTNSNNSVFFNLSIINSSSATDIYLAPALNNTFRNCTLYSNDAASYGIRLTGASTGNLFYYNNISGTYNKYATSTRSENSFNTTVGGKAHGNYWGDIATLDIYDSDSDGFGDAGTQYPYNSSFSSKISVNVTDSGPITSFHCYDVDGDGFYSTSSDSGCLGAYRDCNDNNANVKPPKDDLTITASTILCNGTYYLNDSGLQGVIRISAGNLELRGNNTLIVGNGSGYGISWAVSPSNNVTVRDCNLSRYGAGIATGSPYVNLTNLSVSDNTNTGISLLSSANSTLTDIRCWNNTFIGIQQASNNVKMTRITAWKNLYGLYLQTSNTSNTTDSSFYNNTYGVLLSDSNLSSFFNVTFANNSGSGAEFRGSSLNNITNSTFYNNGYGVNINSTSVSNRFYYNNFTSSTIYQAKADVAGNFFNTTNGSSCGPKCARGNYWSDSYLLQIFDSNNDGYGNFGAQYPYNSANGALVTVNVTDWGPRTDLTPDCVQPYDNLTVESNITLCPGTYYVTDSTADGVIQMLEDDFWVNCTGTVLVGNGSGKGFLIYGDDIHVNDCRITNYSAGIEHAASYDPYFKDIELFNNTNFGMYCSSTGITQMDNVSIHHNSGTGLYMSSCGLHVTSNLTTYNNTAHGVYGIYTTYLNVSNVVSFNNGLSGVLIFSCQNATIRNVTVYGNTVDGLYVGSVFGNVSISDVRSYNNIEDGIGVVDASDTNISSVDVYNNTNIGIFVDADRVNIFNATVSNHSNDVFSGVYLVGENHTMWNSTLDNNYVGLAAYCNYSLFYYNNFLNSSKYHAKSDAGYENQFNITFKSNALGNYWKGVTDLKIFDVNGNGFGDAGLQYPYNATNDGNTSGPITDWGPITTRTDYLMQAPILFTPANNEIVTDSRNPLYGWTNPEHTISDSVTYNIQVDDDVKFLSPAINVVGIAETAISTYYWSASYLDFSKDYYWRVLANDTYFTSAWSTIFNFTILPTVSCTEPIDEVDFGQMCIKPNQTICDQEGLGSHINDTLDNHPPPYVIENDGNLNSSGKVYSTSLWESNTYRAMPSTYYQFMVGVNESDSYLWALDSAWVDMTNVSADAPETFYGFAWTNSSDSFNLHIKLESPTDEPPGWKYSTTYVVCEQNETV